MSLRIYKYICPNCKFEEEVELSSKIKYEECPLCYGYITVEVERNCKEDHNLFAIQRAEDIKTGYEVYLRQTDECHEILGKRDTTKNWEPAISLGYKGHKAITHKLDELLFCKTYNFYDED